MSLQIWQVIVASSGPIFIVLSFVWWIGYYKRDQEVIKQELATQGAEQMNLQKSTTALERKMEVHEDRLTNMANSLKGLDAWKDQVSVDVAQTKTKVDNIEKKIDEQRSDIKDILTRVSRNR